MTTVVDILTQTGNFKTLLQSLKGADMVDTLKGPGPYTVLAPNDEAFTKLSKDTILGWVKDIPKLQNILMYHVIPGKLMAADLAKLKFAKTLQGQNVKIETSIMKKYPKVNGEEIIKTDLIADNGIVHIIEKVLVPQ